MTNEFETVAAVSELPDGGRLAVTVQGRAALLFRTGADYHAVEDICSHDGQPLTDGEICGFALECPWHGAKFDIRTGKHLCMPAIEGIATYEVRVADGQIQLRER